MGGEWYEEMCVCVCVGSHCVGVGRQKVCVGDGGEEV